MHTEIFFDIKYKKIIELINDDAILHSFEIASRYTFLI